MAKITLSRVLVVAVAIASAVIWAIPQTVDAANTNITGGTNGPNCNSGGYFTPSSVTINSGDTVTINVPANDPYAGGVQVHGFPGGNFTILPGASHTTAALTANVSYYGTWPNTGCLKGSGNISVTQPSPPPATPPSTPNTPTTPTSSGSTTSTKTSTLPSSNKAATTTTTSAAANTPSTQSPSPASTPTAGTSSQKSGGQQTKSTKSVNAAPKTDTVLGMNKTAALVGIPVVTLLVIAGAAFAVRHLLFSRKQITAPPTAPTNQASAVTSDHSDHIQTPPSQNSGPQTSTTS